MVHVEIPVVSSMTSFGTVAIGNGRSTWPFYRASLLWRNIQCLHYHLCRQGTTNVMVYRISPGLSTTNCANRIPNNWSPYFLIEQSVAWIAPQILWRYLPYLDERYIEGDGVLSMRFKYLQHRNLLWCSPKAWPSLRFHSKFLASYLCGLRYGELLTSIIPFLNIPHFMQTLLYGMNDTSCGWSADPDVFELVGMYASLFFETVYIILKKNKTKTRPAKVCIESTCFLQFWQKAS